MSLSGCQSVHFLQSTQSALTSTWSVLYNRLTMGIHRIHLTADELPAAIEPGTSFRITGANAFHTIRVKRLKIDDRLEVLDGQGLRLTCTLTEIIKVATQTWEGQLSIDSVTRHDPPVPELHVCSPVPSGRKLDEMIDQLGQVGASSWQPIITDHAIAKTNLKYDRLGRIVSETIKQCGRPYLMELHEEVPLQSVLDATDPATIILADASGEPYNPSGKPTNPTTLLIGPEGGFSEEELAHARQRNITIARFGRHIMRIETAAPVAAGIILHAACLHTPS